MSGGCVDVHRLTEVVRKACIHDLVCESCNLQVASCHGADVWLLTVL